MNDKFKDQPFIAGYCNICGTDTRFINIDPKTAREYFNCINCYSTSRYRSIARGMLRAIEERTGIKAASIAEVKDKHSETSISVLDTQPGFSYESVPCAYPLPQMLGQAPWIAVVQSTYRPDLPLGDEISFGVSNQNLENMTFRAWTFDIVVTSDVMEHVRFDDAAHLEISRVLKTGGLYLFTVPHARCVKDTVIRVMPDPRGPDYDIHLLPPEYHGDANSADGRALAYRRYGFDLDAKLRRLGFDVEYEMNTIPELGIINTELFYCRMYPHHLRLAREMARLRSDCHRANLDG